MPKYDLTLALPHYEVDSSGGVTLISDLQKNLGPNGIGYSPTECAHFALASLGESEREVYAEFLDIHSIF